MAGFNLGTARGIIQIDYQGTGASEAQKALNTTANTAGAAGLAIAGGLAAGVTAAANFEERLSAISAVSGATGSELDRIRDKALQLGKDTAFSATESATAMEELVKAGLSVDDVLNGAADATVALAAAGGVDLPTAATIASNSMNQFNLAAEDLPGIADKIAGAANASAIDVNDFGISMAQVGAVANTVGLGFDDTAQAIALLGNAGIKGSDAGTSLKTMLLNLQPQTEKQKQLFDDLGLTTDGMGNKFFDAQGKIKPLGEIAGELKTALSGMSDAQKTATLETIFGSDAIRAAAVIADEGAEGFNAMGEAMGKVGAAEVAATRMDNLKGSLEEMTGSLETAAIQMGTVMLPIVRNLVDGVTGLVNKFLNLSPATQQTIVVVAALAAGFLLLFAATLKTVSVILSVTRTLQALAALKGVAAVIKGVGIAFKFAAGGVKAFTISLLTNPIFLIIAAIVALGAAIYLFFTKTETGRQLWAAIWAGIQAAVSAVVTWITTVAVPFLQNAWTAIVTGAQSLWSGLQSIWNAIVTVISTAINAVGTAITTGVNFIRNTWNAFWTGLGIIVSTVWNGITAFLNTAVTGIRTLISNFIKGVQVIWSAFWNGPFGQLLKAAWDLVVAIVGFGVRSLQLAIQVCVNKVQSIWSAAWSAVSNFFKKIWDGIVSFLAPIIARVYTTIQSNLEKARNVVRTVLTAIQTVFRTVWNAVATFVVSVLLRVYNAISQRMNAARSLVQSVLNAIRSVFQSVWNAVSSVVTSVLSRIYSAVSSRLNAVRNVVSTALNAAKNAATNAFNAMYNSISNTINRVYSTVRNIMSRIKGIFSGAGSWLVSAGRNIIDGLVRGISNAIGRVTAVLRSVTNKIPDWKGPARTDRRLLRDNGGLIMDGLIEGISRKIREVRGTLGDVTKRMPDYVDARRVAFEVPAQRTSSRSGASDRASLVDRAMTLTQNIYNPVSEPASQATSRGARRLAQIGRFR